MARPRKPTALRLVTGGRTRPHHSKSEPTPDPRAPIPPAWLQGRGLEAWNSVVDELTAIGCTSRLDAGILASRASAMGVIAEAQEMLNTMESPRRLLVTNKRGGPSVNPLIGIIRKAQRDASHYGAGGSAGAEKPSRQVFREQVMTDDIAKGKAEERKAFAALIDATNAMAASMIRNGADADAVKKWVDAQLDRFEAAGDARQ